MLKERARLVSTTLRLVDLAMLTLAFPIAYFLRDRGLQTPRGGLYPISTYWPLLAASLLGWILTSWLAKVYGQYRTKAISTEVGRLVNAFALLCLITIAGQFIWHSEEPISRLFLLLYYSVAFTLLFANRVTGRLVARAARRRGLNTRSFAVVGSGEMPDALVQAMAAHKEWGYTFAGFILEDRAPLPEGAKVLGRVSEMGTILVNHVLDVVIFDVPRDRLEGVEQAMLLCDEQGIGVKVFLDFFPARIAKMSVEELEGIPLLSFSSVPSEAAALVGKRVFDIVMSGLVLIVLSPVFLATALAIKLDSPGPVLFKQRRVGRNGREFWLCKFRSMYQGAERQLGALAAQNEMDGPVFKMNSDPRVTRVGKFIRKTSLDEFPQFWNVFKGEMSVVGPRPPLPEEVKQYKRWQRRRLSVKPGITCIWQVSGRNEIDFTRWMELDLHYIDNWSLWRDLKIVLRTIPAVILGKGAR